MYFFGSLVLLRHLIAGIAVGFGALNPYAQLSISLVAGIGFLVVYVLLRPTKGNTLTNYSLFHLREDHLDCRDRVHSERASDNYFVVSFGGKEYSRTH